MSTPDSNQTSPARRTVSLLRSLCVEAGLLPDKYLRRLCEGFARYGETNHLSPDFDLQAEWDAEILDVVAFPAIAVARGLVTRDDPLLRVYMLAARRMADVQAAMIEQHERDAGPDWDCYAPTQRKCHRCEGQCFTE